MSVNQERALKVKGESKSLGFDVSTKENRRLILGRAGAGKQGWDIRKLLRLFSGKEETRILGTS